MIIEIDDEVYGEASKEVYDNLHDIQKEFHLTDSQMGQILEDISICLKDPTWNAK